MLALAATWYRYATYRSSTYDLAIFEQAVWKMAHGHAPYVTVIGANIFGDHLSPVLLAFVPLYRLASTPVWFFVAQAVGFGLGFLAVPAFADAAGGTRFRTSFALAYAVSPLVWNPLLFDFHSTTLAVPVLLVGITAALRDDTRALLLAAVALVVLNDDLAPAVSAMALCGVMALPAERRRVRWPLVAAGVAWFAAGGAVAAVLGVSRNWFARYGHLATSPTAALTHPVHTVAAIARSLARRRNATFAASLLLPLGFLPLLSPAALALAAVLALPLVVARDPKLQQVTYHYAAPLFPFLALGAARGLAKLTARVDDTAAAVWLGTTAVVSLVAIGPGRTGALTAHTVSRRDARRAAALIRPTDAVSATSELGAHLAHRRVLYQFPVPFRPSSSGRFDPPREHVNVVAVRRPNGTAEEQLLRDLEASPPFAGFQRTAVGGVFVYRRGVRP